ncbi:MAG TPA: CapA family protein [Candidatus Acidoferrales bacterium]|nr:CapA family protein [Candidatus Acidoferrales bacterium]
MKDNHTFNQRLSAALGIVAFAILLAGAAAASRAQQAAGPVVRPPNGDPNAALAATVPDGFTVAATGDLIVHRPISNEADPAMQAVFKILRGATVSVGNFEGTAIDVRHFRGAPQAENGGAWIIDLPGVPDDVKRMGFSMVERANNHATDWGVEGMEETDKRLDDAGLIHAGTGKDLAAARAPRYLDTPVGRVALVSMASSFLPMSRAMDPLGETNGRPGLSALRTTAYTVVPQDLFDQIKRVGDELQALKKQAGIPAPSAPPGGNPPKPNEVNLNGARFRLGDRFGLSYDMDSFDLQQILKGIRQGKESANFLIATIHCHEPGNWSEQPADFLVTLAHDAIDQGADEFVAQGPHQLRGIEIYKGKPIFYSLGNFIFQNLMLDPVGMDYYLSFHLNPDTATDEEFDYALTKRGFWDPVWFESVVAVSRFDRNQVSEIDLYPIDLGFERPAPDFGNPRMAPPAAAKKILERLQRLSTPYHTPIEIRNNVGVIKLR